MKIEDIEIHVGEPPFPFAAVRRLEAKCEAATAFSSAPTMDQVNAKLREMAAGLGANAIVQVEYKSGMSKTSWRSMSGTGLAVRKLTDDIQCPVCAETIKQAALKCRYCGADVPKGARQAAASTDSAPSEIVSRSPDQIVAVEPLRSTNNPQWSWILPLILLAVFVLILSLMWDQR